MGNPVTAERRKSVGEKHPAGRSAKQAGSSQLLPLLPWEKLLRGCAGFGWDNLGAPGSVVV